MAVTIILIVYGASIELLLICVLWIPNFHIPRLLGLAGIILSVPYLGGIFVLFYGIGPTIGITGTSTAEMLRELFPGRSKSTHGANQEVEKHDKGSNSETWGRP